MQLILVGVALYACSTTTITTEGLDYEDFNYIEAYSEIFDRREGTYLIYLYEPTCANCNKIKTSVLSFAAGYTAHPIYFFDVTGIEDEAGEATYLAKTGQTTLSYPALIVVIDNDFDLTNKAKYLYTGVSKIPLVLTDMKNGVYDWA
jgi:hypothetical protein